MAFVETVQICALFALVFEGAIAEIPAVQILAMNGEIMTKEYSAPTVLRRRQVEELTGLARSTIYELMHRGLFPVPVRLSKRAVGWRYREIEAWINSRRAAM